MAIVVLRNSELMVAHIDGDTEEEIEFIDSYYPPTTDYVVLDAGRLMLREADVDVFVKTALEQGLVVVVEKQS